MKRRWLVWLGLSLLTISSFGFTAWGSCRPEIMLMRTCREVIERPTSFEPRGWTMSFSTGDIVNCVLKLEIPNCAPRQSYTGTMRWYAPDGELYGEWRVEDLDRNTTWSLYDWIDTGREPAASMTGQWRIHFSLMQGPSKSLVFTVSGPLEVPSPVGPPNQPPVASFSFSPASPSVSEWVRFDATSSDDTDGPVVSYSWNFGDGSTDSGMMVYHRFTTAGTYTVTLRVTDDAGASNTTTQTVHVSRVEEELALLFDDDFSDADSGWLVYNDPVCEYSYSTGMYLITVKQPQKLRWSWAPNETFPADFTVEIEAQKSSGPDGSYGIIWGSDEQNFFLFNINTEGWYSVDQMVNGAWQTSVVPSTRHDVINQGGGRNRLKLTAKEDSFTLWVNRIELQTVTAPSFGDGKIAVFVLTYEDSNITVSFDNFKVYEQ